VPVRIVNLTDAESLEAQLIENLQRRDVHPLEEAQGFKALLNLEDPKYSIEQIAAKVGKSPAYCAALCGQPHNIAYVVKLLMLRSVLRRLAKIQIKLESDLEE
jgi:ParB family transcriptional regulator, chromosome partitioning protein